MTWTLKVGPPLEVQHSLGGVIPLSRGSGVWIATYAFLCQYGVTLAPISMVRDIQEHNPPPIAFLGFLQREYQLSKDWHRKRSNMYYERPAHLLHLVLDS